MIEQGGLLQELYRAEVTGGWERGMRVISHTLLDRHYNGAGVILDLGCGGGAFADELGVYHEAVWVAGTDLRDDALETARQRFSHLQLCKSDAQYLPFASASFDLVSALDLLDQKGVDPDAALAEIRRVIRPMGWLLVRVSAYRWLQGMHDRAFNTGRRFQRLELALMLSQAGFMTMRITYANTLLSLPIVVFRLLQRWRWLPFAPAVYRIGLANRFMEQSLRLEARWLLHGDFPFGISLYALARRSG